jgi:hypothetical protein
MPTDVPMDVDLPAEEEDGADEQDAWDSFGQNNEFLWKLKKPGKEPDVGFLALTPLLQTFVNPTDSYIRVTHDELKENPLSDTRYPGFITVLYVSNTSRPLLVNSSFPDTTQGLPYRRHDGSVGLAEKGKNKTRSNVNTVFSTKWKAIFDKVVKTPVKFKPTRYVDPAIDIQMVYQTGPNGSGLNSLGISFDDFKQIVTATVAATKPKQRVQVAQVTPNQNDWTFVGISLLLAERTCRLIGSIARCRPFQLLPDVGQKRSITAVSEAVR